MSYTLRPASQTEAKHKCSVCGCDVAIPRRGMCSIHYRRFMRHGDPHKLLVRSHGEGTRHINGYWAFQIAGRVVLRHVLVAERALGKRLPKGAEVHHVDYDRSNDRNDNLVICPNRAYHRLLHARTDALNACGHADWRRCGICKQYDAPQNIVQAKISKNIWHPECRDDYERKRKARKNALHV